MISGHSPSFLGLLATSSFPGGVPADVGVGVGETRIVELPRTVTVAVTVAVAAAQVGAAVTAGSSVQAAPAMLNLGVWA